MERKSGCFRVNYGFSEAYEAKAYTMSQTGYANFFPIYLWI